MVFNKLPFFAQSDLDLCDAIKNDELQLGDRLLSDGLK